MNEDQSERVYSEGLSLSFFLSVLTLCLSRSSQQSVSRNDLERSSKVKAELLNGVDALCNVDDPEDVVELVWCMHRLNRQSH